MGTEPSRAGAIEKGPQMAKCRILVVDDYEPYRRLVRSLVQERHDLQIVGEASDGLECVQKARELEPNLILLDIGLPGINGIQAARRLRDLVPKAKVLFLSIESSADVVREALNSGGSAYVNKGHAVQDLLPAIDIVLKGGRFVGNGLEEPEPIETPAAPVHQHEMVICGSGPALVESFQDFIAAALVAEKPTILIATRPRLDDVLQRLSASGIDVAAATESGSLILSDVAEVLSAVMVNGLPDRLRFAEAANDILQKAARAAKGDPVRVAACGEISPTLWAEGKTDAALLCERLWDAVGKEYELDTLCAYPASDLGDRGKDREKDRAVKILCGIHSVVHRR